MTTKVDDPTSEYWGKLAEACDVVAQNPTTGPEDAAKLCQALDNFTTALMVEKKMALPMTVDEIKALRTECRASPYVADQFWFVLMVRAVEKRFGLF